MHVDIHIICLAKGSGTLFFNKNIKKENEKVNFIFCLKVQMMSFYSFHWSDILLCPQLLVPLVKMFKKVSYKYIIGSFIVSD